MNYSILRLLIIYSDICLTISIVSKNSIALHVRFKVMWCCKWWNSIWLSLYIVVEIRTCMYTIKGSHAHVYMQSYAWMHHIHIHTHTHTHTHTYTHAQIYTNTHIHTHTNTHTQTHTHMHIYTHSRTHTFMYTQHTQYTQSHTYNTHSVNNSHLDYHRT